MIVYGILAYNFQENVALKCKECGNYHLFYTKKCKIQVIDQIPENNFW